MSTCQHGESVSLMVFIYVMMSCHHVRSCHIVMVVTRRGSEKRGDKSCMMIVFVIIIRSYVWRLRHVALFVTTYVDSTIKLIRLVLVPYYTCRAKGFLGIHTKNEPEQVENYKLGETRRLSRPETVTGCLHNGVWPSKNLEETKVTKTRQQKRAHFWRRYGV